MVVDVLDVLDALALEPGAEGLAAALPVDGNSVLPGRTAAQHAREPGPCFARQLERLGELRVAHAGGKVDEGPRRDIRRAAEMVHGLLLRVRLLPAERFGALDELHVDR